MGFSKKISYCRNNVMAHAQETYSRRNNLMIRGIPEKNEETEEMCITAVRNFLIKEMNIDAAAVSRMTLVRCHRVGRNIPHFKRPIIVRFLDYNNKKLIWNKRFDIMDKTLSISENYANIIEYRRRLLYPIVKKAKQFQKYGKVYIKGDSIIVNNSTYSFDNLHKVPKNFHPKQFSYKENKDWFIFGGPHSVLNFLSN